MPVPFLLHACLLSCFRRVWVCDPMDASPTGSSGHEILQVRVLEWVAMTSSRRSSWPRGWTQVSHIAFFTIWTTKEAQEYWSGSLSLLQGIFLTQELHWCLLPCRQIFYQLSDHGGPRTLHTYVSSAAGLICRLGTCGVRDQLELQPGKPFSVWVGYF